MNDDFFASADSVLAEITLQVDGRSRRLTVDTRTSLLDALRERLGNTSPKIAATTASAVPARCSRLLHSATRSWVISATSVLRTLADSVACGPSFAGPAPDDD